ncbi:hypothetical protein [Plantactinospora sp. KLBMP9567]|uniref:hypothetical protein n=1 Tax=Plantactinospora sp. KLBMP9567 TaxID=3085900 RepID=UPI0029823FAC|nr:hypothetical protein [Plantactinospora sp. KLBMP9567]MDW5327180.1 hypothetical protein [Plantactinospora sp. KLBMP9567]
MDEPSSLYRFGRSWNARPSGLYVPQGHDQPPPTIPSKERHKVTDWLQGLGTMVAAAIAALALLVGAETLQDQQQINHDQLAFNQESRKRSKQRYISRVSWWPEYVAGTTTVRIQNRAPVPLNDVELEVRFPESITNSVNGWPAEFVKRYPSYSAVPPCSTVTLTILSEAEVVPPGPMYESAVDAPPDPMVGTMEALWVDDYQGTWKLTPGAAAELFDFPPISERPPSEDDSHNGMMREQEVRQEVPDCGEDG